MTRESTTSTSVQSPSALEDPIRQLVWRWKKAWNDHDAPALAELVVPDVDFVTVAGRWLQGVEEFLAWHGEIHRKHMRDSRWSNLNYRWRQLNAALCLVHLEWTTVGDRSLQDTPRSARHGVFTWLVAQQDNCWRIVAAHNTELRDASRHRLRMMIEEL